MSVLRTLGVLCAAAVITGGVGAPALAGGSATDLTQSFSAHSGDACRLGAARGTIVWHQPPAGRTVDGTATVSDRLPSPGCGDDGRNTVLVLTARAGGEVVDQEVLEADNGQRTYRFALSAAVPVTEVVVRVCRRGTVGSYCGATQTLPAPIFTAG
jgi:hypothetical protein